MFLDDEPRGRYLVIVVKDGQDYQLVIFGKEGGKEASSVKVKGFGLLGNYGEVSYEVQGPYLVMLSHNKLTLAVPEKE